MEGSRGIGWGESWGSGREIVTWVWGQKTAQGGAQDERKASKCENEAGKRASEVGCVGEGREGQQGDSLFKVMRW